MAPQPQRAFTIRMFLPDGTPEGIKWVDKSNWIGRAVVFPRSRFADLRRRPEFTKAGIYVLLGQAEGDELPTMYIGEGDPIADRLISHYKTKEFWSSAIFIISKDENLNKAHVQYLESRLYGLAKEVKRSILDNGNAPQPPTLSEAEAAEMEGFLSEALLIFGVLGVNVFQKPEPVTHSTVMLYLNAKGLTAEGYEVDNGFVVRAGSQSPVENAPTLPDSVAKLRQTLLGQGLFVQESGYLKLTQDYPFTSPSMAAAVMLARTANGRIEWKDATGRTLKGIQEARVS
jgi:hypothetical protein